MTPHINAAKEDIADIVLMPGDPYRAKWAAENFLTKPRLVNQVGGCLVLQVIIKILKLPFTDQEWECRLCRFT